MTNQHKKYRRLTPPTDSERETRVLLEEVRFELRVVAEGHTSIIRRLDNVENGLGEVKGKLDRVEGRLGHLEGQMTQLQNQVGSVLTDHESRLKALETK